MLTTKSLKPLLHTSNRDPTSPWRVRMAIFGGGILTEKRLLNKAVELCLIDQWYKNGRDLKKLRLFFLITDGVMASMIHAMLTKNNYML